MYSLRKMSVACLCLLFVTAARPSAQTPAAAPPGVQPPPGTRMLDAYGNIRCGDLSARLDLLYVVLSNERDAEAYVFVYGERGRRLSDANTVSRLVRHRLFNVERIPHRRITVVYGGTRYVQSVALWIVPRGARPPTPSRD